MIFYSPKTSLHNGKQVQAFTAVAKIKDRDAYQVLINDTSHTANVLYMKTVEKYQ